MFDASANVLYVGKAKNLKKRLSSYFRARLDSPKTVSLMSQVVDIQVTITNSENEALLLEANLIKELTPRYNVLLRDDKSYPYLYLSKSHPFPRLDYHRGAKTHKGRYFGPYPSGRSVRENLASIQKLFQLRQCEDSVFNHRSRPCLQYQINRCTGPCVGKVSEEDYAEQVKRATLFLEGKNTRVMDNLTDAMEKASEHRQYELAAKYRDQIRMLRQFQRQQNIVSDSGNVDVVSPIKIENDVAIGMVFIRRGRVLGHKVLFPKVPKDIELSALLDEFMPQFYLQPHRKDEGLDKILVSVALEDKKWIEDALRVNLGDQLKIIDSIQPRFRQWFLMATTNAKYALSQRLNEKMRVSEKLKALQACLNFEAPIQRIECFDISHTMGEATVASCVVYGKDGPMRQAYRRYNIQGLTPGDDYAAMHQVLTRRYSRLIAEESDLPSLILIDGGKGQVAKAAEVLNALAITEVPILGIAKGTTRKPGFETLILHGQSFPIHLPPDDQALHLLQYIRDEAHRFAITTHRKKRAKSRTHSVLEFIEGVGAKRRKDLLQYFGGMQELKKANIEEIASVPGISLTLAERIYTVLQEE